MSVLKFGANILFRPRLKRLEHIRIAPDQSQKKVEAFLFNKLQQTQFAKDNNLSQNLTYKTFAEKIPIRSYEEIFPWIERTIKGEKNILWPGRTDWFSKSSGTTNARNKFIPVTREALEDCHFRGGLDMFSQYLHCVPDSKIFQGKQLTLGGSLSKNNFRENSWLGDISAVLIKNIPRMYEWMRSPNPDLALMENWETKIQQIASAVSSQNIISSAGVPTWMLLLFKKVLELSGKKNMAETWPNFEVFFHGGVNFSPYQNTFKNMFSPQKINFVETYNASEGFFAFQDASEKEGMLVLADHGIFYEFIPLERFNTNDFFAIRLEEVEIEKNYVMVISTNAGLWRYITGDTVRFVSTFPHRLKVSGRTKNYINTFGEELMVENAEEAIRLTCLETGASIVEFTAGPIFFEGTNSGAHEWLVEFEVSPPNKDAFRISLDNHLRNLNADYDAKRQNNLVLRMLEMTITPSGLFQRLLNAQNRTGAQAKIPRLQNDRKLLEQLKGLM